ncbi:MAG: hypothetical protein KGL39_42055 [Patescibacteria group bacterium]|nr:hypothetical protein [Patescibacteria group bacterium]
MMGATNLKVGEWAIVDGPAMLRRVRGSDGKFYEGIEDHPWNGFICMIMSMRSYPGFPQETECVVRFWDESDPRNEIAVSASLLKSLRDVTPERAEALLNMPKPGPNGEPAIRLGRQLDSDG